MAHPLDALALPSRHLMSGICPGATVVYVNGESRCSRCGKPTAYHR